MKHFFFLLPILFIVACSQPRIDATTDESLKSSVSEVRASLPEERREAFNEAIEAVSVAASLGSIENLFQFDEAKAEQAMRDELHGKTAEEVFQRAKEVRESAALREAEEERAAKAAIARRESQVEKLRQMVSVVAASKRFIDRDWEDFNVFTVLVTNNSGSAIQAVKGRLRVSDLFGDHITNLEIKVDEPLDASTELLDDFAYDYNQFSDEDNTLRYTEFEKLRFAWEPEVIIMADGMRFEVPSE